jgi:anti-anti-sigma factor
MPLEVQHFDRIPVVRVPLDIDAANAATVRDELVGCMRNDAFDLIVDLSETPYLDSAGIDMLFRLNRSLSDRRATLRLVIRPESDLARLSELVAIPHSIAVHADVADAVQAAARLRPEPPGDI